MTELETWESGYDQGLKNGRDEAIDRIEDARRETAAAIIRFGREYYDKRDGRDVYVLAHLALFLDAVERGEWR